MAEFIKAYNYKDKTVFEVAVRAIDSRAAKVRGSLWLFGKSPADITSMQNIRVMQMGDEGIVNEYRVIMEIDSSEDLRELLKINSVIRYIEENL